MKSRRGPAATSAGRRHNGWAAALPVALMFALGVSVVVWRRPDAVANPQFWAEDGYSWFADAYNTGVASLLRGEAGYLQTLPRLVAVPGSYLSLVQAALLFNLVGIAVQVAPAAFFVSRRFEHVAADVRVRALVGLVYLLIPTFELNVTVTNAQWHLAVLAAMVLIAEAPRHGWVRAFDLSVIVLCSLTGPFGLLLLPAALARVLLVRPGRRWYASLSGGIVVALVLQGWTLLHSHREAPMALGAGIKNAFFLVADRVVLAGSFAEEGHTKFFTHGRPHGAVLAGAITLGAVVVVAIVVRRGTWQLRMFLFVCFAITAVAMLSPLASASATPAWTVMASSSAGERYFFSSQLAWLVCVVWFIAGIGRRALRYGVTAVVALIFLSGVVRYSHYPPYADLHPSSYDQQLRAAAPGATVTVPINPNWTMTLKRHP